jgi:hypothetical protein
MAELCSTSPLLAASPVRLSLSNATDYATIVVVNTNLLKGIGMGAGGAYRILRAEDIEFLHEALNERLLLAPGVPWFVNYVGKINQIADTGMVPYESKTFAHSRGEWPETIASNSAWQTSYSGGYAFGLAGLGFVPSSFALWTGGALSPSTNAWLRNGYDATKDIRAVFSADSRLFPTNELPSIPAFDGVPDFATMTNAYALLDSPYVRTALYVEEPLKSRCAYSNELSVAIDYIDVTYQYTEYQIPGTSNTAKYASGYTETPSSYSYTYRSAGNMDALVWYATHEVEYDTPYDIEYTSAERKGGKVHALTPYKARDSYSTTLPDVSTPWRMGVRLQRGWDASGRLYNTNLAIRAYAVFALKCTSSTTTRRNYVIPEVPTTSTSSNLVRNVTVCLDLGALSIVEGVTVDRGVPVYEAATTPFDIAQTFRTAIAYAETNGAFDHGLFAQVPIPDPAICDPADYPETTTKSTGGGGTATSVHEHAMQCVKIYFILLISPTYHARVLDD